MWPLILRELRAGSRRWTSYWLRLLSATTVIIAVLLWFDAGAAPARAGSELFAWIHRMVLVSIWILVPLMACDCLSQEKREGTLGLLFLTHLKPRDIVAAKVCAHGLRAVALWISAVPIIGLPLLMGGLTGREIVLSCCICAASICFALAAGIAASVMSRRINGAVMLSLLFSFVGMGLFAWIAVFISFGVAVAAGVPLWRNYAAVNLIEQFARAIAFLLDAQSMWRASFPVGLSAWSPVFLYLPAAFIVLFLTIVAAAAVLRGTWQDRPRSKRQQEVDRIFFTPVFWASIFKRWMRWVLNRNPIGWLEQRTWTGRIASMVWFAIMISFSSVVLTYPTFYYGDGLVMLNGLMGLLLASIAYVAAGSFRRERETGALELILVTPLDEKQIIFGRLNGLWLQFLPAALLWGAVECYSFWLIHKFAPHNDHMDGAHRVMAVLPLGIGYFVVPAIGLYFSLRTRFVLLAWIGTLAVWYALPAAVTWIVHGFLFPFREREFADANVFVPLFGTMIQIGLAAFLLWRLRELLLHRTFSFRTA